MNACLPNVPLDQYIRDSFHDGPPSLSSSIAHLLLTRSPAHARQAHAKLNPSWSADDSGTRQIIGSATHAILLEGDRSRVVTIPYADYKKKAAQEMRDSAVEHGLLPVLEDDLTHIDAAVEAARTQLAQSEIPDALLGGKAEHTLLWTDASGTTWRSRPDWISAGGDLLIDLKCTGGNGEPDTWSRGPLLAHGADLQCALALRGMHELCGADHSRTFVFAVLEMAPPYALSLVALDPQFIEFANDKLDAAARIWKACLASGEWSAYPSRICWAAPPEYVVYRWGEKRELRTRPIESEDDSVEAL